MKYEEELLSLKEAIEYLKIKPERIISVTYNEPRKIVTVTAINEGSNGDFVINHKLSIPLNRIEEINIMPKENETKAEHFLNMKINELEKYFSSELDVGLSNIFIFPKKERIQLRSTFFLSKEMKALQEFFKDCPMEITYANENIRLTYDISSWDKIIWEG
jgi:hypothetical protein